MIVLLFVFIFLKKVLNNCLFIDFIQKIRPFRILDTVAGFCVADVFLKK